MSIKVSELEGQLLDDWVARAHGWIDKGNDWWGTEAPGTTAHRVTWHPSTDWNEGGPIIEREGICCGKNGPLGSPHAYEAGEDTAIQYGPTLLIAAMRAYVASKFGEEVTDGA